MPSTPPTAAEATVLAINTGSSSIKLSAIGPGDELLASAHVDGWDGDPAPINSFLKEAPPALAIGHRVVHGGTRFSRATPVDDEVLAAIDALTPFAPLHQPNAVLALRAARAARPDTPSVACFDTAYHADMPLAAATYALPRAWRERWPVRRYGFHGLSHAWATRRAEAYLPPALPAKRVVTAHLGSGASLCASLDGRSMDTTMGFTPLGGLMMQTRSGSVDPGLVLWLQKAGGLSADAVADGLLHHAGLAGFVEGGDMRDVLAREAEGDEDARLALGIYVHAVASRIAALCTSLGGLDALVFTGGIGENSSEVRRRVADRLAFLGVALDQATNLGAEPPELDISACGASVRTLLVEAREDLEIARETRAALNASY